MPRPRLPRGENPASHPTAPASLPTKLAASPRGFFCAGIFILHAIGLVAGYLVKLFIVLHDRFWLPAHPHPHSHPHPHALPPLAAGPGASPDPLGSPDSPTKLGRIGGAQGVLPGRWEGEDEDPSGDFPDGADGGGGLRSEEDRRASVGGVTNREAGLVRARVEAMSGQARGPCSVYL